jgi:transcriptional regulator with XRE-family HTH domain
MDEAFAMRLREAMDLRGVRPSALARGLHVYAGTVSRWRKGECPDDLRMPEIANFLRVNVDWLRSGTGDREPVAHTEAPSRPAERRSPDAPTPGATRRASDEERPVRRSIVALQEQATLARRRVLDLYKAGEITPELAGAWLEEIQRFLSAGEAHESL